MKICKELQRAIEALEQMERNLKNKKLQQKEKLILNTKHKDVS